MTEERKVESFSDSGNNEWQEWTDAATDTYDSEEEPPKRTESDLLTWRLDPAESLSDWTIEINSMTMNSEGALETNKTDTYHVHKSSLALGPRKSEYFFKLFQDGGRFSETSSNKSCIDLNELAAKAFPDMLDYIYAHDKKLNVNTENATALHYLGQYFGVQRLRWDVKEFWQKDMTVQNCGLYYEHARILQGEKILKAAGKMATENIMSIDTSSRLVQIPCLEFWLDLLRSSAITEKLSRHVSMLIAEFCSNTELSQADSFGQLTSVDYLPVVHFGAALKLIDLENTIVCPDAETLTSLQMRCLAALADNWNRFDVDEDGIATTLCKQNPLLLTELLKQSLSVARKDSAKLRKEKEAACKEREDCMGELRRFVRVTAATHHLRVDSSPRNDGPTLIDYEKEGVVGEYNIGGGETKDYLVFYYRSS